MTLTPNRAWRFLEWVLFFVAALGLGVWAWATLTRVAYQQWGDWSFGNRSKSAKISVDVPVSDGSLLGRVIIPRLGVNTLVREGTTDATLRVAAGHITGTAMPGRPGNVGVAAHRDSLFRGLRNVHNNDLIFFETSTGRHAYRVESTSIVHPEDVAVLDPGSHPQLTLVTCYPFSWIGFAPERFIVKAREVSESDAIPLTKVVSAPAPVPPVRTKGRRVYFEIPVKHSRTLAPGISIGVTDTDVESNTVEGWLWLMPDRRTIWLRGQDANTPLPFYEGDGRERKLVITHVSREMATGYLQLPE